MLRQPPILAGLLLIPMTVYLLSMPRTITLEDAGLFQMVCHEGGISHPPGYPTFTLACQALTSLPFYPDGVVGLNALSALFASLAVVMTATIIWQLTGNRSLSMIAGLAYGLSATFWSQAIIVEVYSLAALLFVVTWYLVIRYMQEGRLLWLYLAAFTFGISLTNHWPLMLLSAPALLATGLLDRELIMKTFRSPRAWLVSIACLLAGLIPYLQLLIVRDPVISVFGGIDGVRDLAWYIARSGYEDTQAFAAAGDRLKYAGWLGRETLTQFGYPGIPLMAIGLVLSFRQLPTPVAIALVLVYLGGTFLLNFLLNFRFDPFWQAIYRPYPVIAFLAPAVWFALGAIWLADLIAARLMQPRLGYLVQVFLVAVVLISNLGLNYRAGNAWVENFGRTVLASLPPESVLFVRGDFEVGVFGYLHRVEGLRPDLELRSWNHLVYPNRLSDDVTGGDAAQAAIQAFLATTEKPVFVASASLSPTVTYGAVNRYAPGMPQSAGRMESTGPLVDYVLSLYRDGLITDGHEINIAYFLLIQFTRHHLALARGTTLTPLETARLDTLQQTFPGRLATLEAAVRFDQFPLTSEFARTLALATDIPAHVPLDSRAVFHEYRGRVLASNPESRHEALAAFDDSLDVIPSQENRSLCAIAQYFPAELDRYTAKYGQPDCGTNPDRNL